MTLAKVTTPAPAATPKRSIIYDPTADMPPATPTPNPQPTATPQPDTEKSPTPKPDSGFTAPVKVDQFAAGFSYVLPRGWELREEPGADAKVAFIRKRGSDKVDAQIRFTVVGSADTLAMVEVAYLKQLRAGFEAQGFTDYHVIQNLEFVTTEPRPGSQVIFEMTFGQLNIMRHVCYFFERKDGRKLIATCYSVDRGSTYDDVFDSIMLTLRITK